MERILLVDDEPIARASAEHVLAQAGYKVVLASNGEEGWEVLERSAQRISLVVLDWLMPIMDGAQFLQKLKSSPSFQSIPVIMLTSVFEAEAVAKVTDVGVYDYLTKPVQLNALLELVGKALLPEKAGG
jgi:CheY-like chemotaxis protein